MALSTQPYKGTRDFYPEDMRIRRWMFDRMRAVARSFGYEEYDGPMLEPFDLYAAKTGEEIVNHQLYWLVDQGERKLAVRPEMTPTLARMVAGKIHELPKPVRWFSIPNLWRYERPQRGRLREHWQLNVDVLGGDALDADTEILSFALELVDAFGGLKHVKIQVNHRGLVDQFFQSIGLTAQAALGATKALDLRAKIGDEAYGKMLTELGLSADAQKKMEAFFTSSFEKIAREHPGPAVEHLKKLFAALQGFGDQVEFNPQILRGMDYYTGTVFEMYDTSPENRRALFGGGRYDNLVGLFGKDQLPGVGLGWGDVGMQNFLETHALLPKFDSRVDVFVSVPSEDLKAKASEIARALRKAGVSVVTPLGVGGFGAQLKQASKLGARFAVLLGETELRLGQVMLKDLNAQAQSAVAIAGLAQEIRQKI
jgi:histidyl-tRNA synthetase